MEVEHNGIIFTNENLKVGDKVYPISNGITDNTLKKYTHREYDFRDFICGYPDEPHNILDLNYDGGRQGKAYEVRTSCGYGPIEKYYKIKNLLK